MQDLIGPLTLLGTALLALLVLLTGMLVRGVRRPPRHTAGYALARALPLDPGDLGMSFETWSLSRPDGAVLPVWEIAGNAPVDGSGAPPGLTAVFVHGWGQSRIDMLARLGPWPRLCTRLVLYDLRGHGDAEHGLSRLGSGEERDLLALLERLGPDPVILVAWSLGATVALNAVLQGGRAAAGVVGVVAYGPYLDFAAALRGKLRSLGYPTRPITELAIAWLTLRGMRPPSLGRSVAALSCPLLVVHGERDAISPLDGARRLAETAPRGTLAVMPAAAHADHHETDEQAHDEAISAF
ncbi:MAG: alpha/beta fold hydrolase, partial [Planctomycetota bacterium]